MTNKKLLKFALEKKLCEMSFYEFFKAAWIVVEPAVPLSTNWHHKYICDMLQEECERIIAQKPKTKDIIINVPFRSTKSLIVTVMFPVWAWIKSPKLRFITSSYSATLSIELATKSRDIIFSDWFKVRWGDVFHIKKDQNLKERYENNFVGMRRATSVGGTVTGQGGDFLIVDDPLSPQMANSATERENANEWYRTTFYSRLNQADIGVRIIIMQRVHEDDLSGFLLDRETRTKYRHICIPATNEDGNIKPKSLEKFYNQETGLFWEDRFSRKILDDYKSALGTYGYAGQLQQTPTPLDSGMIHKDWFKIDRYRVDEAIVNFVIDPAYTANEKNDPSALLAYTYKDNKWQIVDCINVYKEFPELVKFIPQWVKKNGYTNRSRIYVEPKASGKSIVQTLVRETGLNVKEDKPPTKDKVARVSDVSASLESGRVSLLNGEWNHKFLEQLVKFPAAKHDDMVDCLVMAVNKEIWSGGSKILYFS
jgi:predicted phage terminase large subunit-like protein|tara:strand:+ start:814 stop:2256 length:1443 start_codon:yes stop_codon:yes gene_type:complete